jgi:NADPH2:quinone reductase
VLPLPPGFAARDGAAFAFTYGTSHHALIDRGQLKAGETVLVLGAAGGVGTAALQIAKAAGAKVIAAASTDEKCALCKPWAPTPRSTTARRTCATLKALTGGKGPDVVYDPVGGDLAEPVFRSIAWRGRYLVIGFAGGGIPALPLNLALLKGAAIVGVFWGDFVRREPQASAAASGSNWRSGTPRQGQAGHRPAPADERTASRLHPHGLAPGAGKLLLVNP